MKLENSRLWRILEVSTAVIQLNVMWLISCLLVITIFPATVALFSVVRQWHLHDDYRVTAPFVHYFIECVRRYRWLSLGWIACALFLVVDLLIASRFTTFQVPFLSGLFAIALLFTMASLYLFPLVAHFEMNSWTAIRSAFFCSIRFIPLTALMIALLCLVGGAFYWSPLTLFVSFTSVALLITKLCQPLFHRFIVE